MFLSINTFAQNVSGYHFSAFTSNHIVIKSIPNISAGADKAFCSASTQLNCTAQGIYEPVILYTENFESYSTETLGTSSVNLKVET